MKRIRQIFVCLAFVNCFVFMIHAGLIGGSPGNGKIENAKHYIGEHGHYTEVSGSTFSLDNLYEFITVIVFLVALLAVMDSLLSKRK